eukprot:Rhum_TRINITY_DN3779_c0_g1::Rhum_TRINITY_DN3779_c0_g1_i1::g.11995::m.11995
MEAEQWWGSPSRQRGNAGLSPQRLGTAFPLVAARADEASARILAAATPLFAREDAARRAVCRAAEAAFAAAGRELRGARLAARAGKTQRREEARRAWTDACEELGRTEIEARRRVAELALAEEAALSAAHCAASMQGASEAAVRGGRVRRRERKLESLRHLCYKEEVRLGVHAPTNEAEAALARLVWEQDMQAEEVRESCTREGVALQREEAWRAYVERLPVGGGGGGRSSSPWRMRAHAVLGVELGEGAGHGLPGVWVATVAAGSPAEAAGVRAGDLITGADGAPVRELAAFRTRLA